MKICSKCKTEKPLTCFNKLKCGRNGYSPHCKSCDHLIYLKHTNPMKNLERFLKRKYNLSLEAYNSMYVSQNGVCAMCLNPERIGHRLSVDHCHKTGKVRGLLCNRCNIVAYADDINMLSTRIAYLELHNQENV